MTAAAERSLFAAKGRAAPVGAGASAEAEVADAAADGPAAPRPLEPVPNAAAEAHAGSLLSFRLRSTPSKPALTDELKAALTRPAPSDPRPAPEPHADAAAAEANGQKTRAQEAALRAPTAQPVAAPASPAAVPRPTAAARIDTPLFPQPRKTREVPLAARAPVRYTPPPAAAWRTALPIGSAALAIATVGWLISRGEPPDAAMPAAVSVAAEPAPAATEPQLPPAEAEATVAQPATAEAAVAEAATPAPVAEAMPGPEADEPEAAMPDSLPEETVPPVVPSFEVVRVAPDAPPVIAGRAAPGSELIVLDNGTTIGTARADANGEWAMVADAPLPAGRHELTLAIATAEGAIVVEQADVPADPAPAETADLPYPAHKPAAGSPASITYMVQLASVPSAADAEREWTRLQQAYAAQLGAADGEIDAVEIGDRGTFYRVRTGPFTDRETAHRLCRELDAAGQECLVVRRAASQ